MCVSVYLPPPTSNPPWGGGEGQGEAICGVKMPGGKLRQGEGVCVCGGIQMLGPLVGGHDTQVCELLCTSLVRPFRALVSPRAKTLVRPFRALV